MNLELHAPAASLSLLGLMGLIAFVRVRALMKRYGAAEVLPETTAAESQPWWTSHLDDYTKGSPPGPEVCGGEPAPCHEEYEMTAPVELWFDEVRVAVRPGSDTDARFQRFAAVLLEELRSARARS